VNGADLKLLCVSEKIEVVRDTAKFIEARRPDGFTIFLDKYSEDAEEATMLAKLNAIRLYADPDDVIFMVGFIRGIQIATAYARRQGRTIDPRRFAEAIPVVRSLADGKGQRKRQRRITAERPK
jgi:hypothetical protein